MLRTFGGSLIIIAIMRPPCDDGAIRSRPATASCPPEAGAWILTAAILGSSMAFIDSTVVNVALPALQSSLGATVIDAQWVVESYGLFLGALILVGGSVGDLLGRRRIFLAGVTVFAAASAWCGLSPSIHQLVIARALQGVGAAFLVPGSLAIISASFDEKERGRAIGTWSGFTAITAALGPVLGGWLIQHASWRWAFFINLPFAAAVIAISLKHVPESRSAAAKQVDWLGAVLVTVGLGGLVYGLIESARLGWIHPLVFGSLIVGAVCLTIFSFVEARVAAPMVPLQLFQSRTFTGANLLTLFLYAAVGIFFFLFPLNLIQVQGYSATATGAAALPTILLLFLLSRWSGGLVARYGPRLPLIVGPLITAVGFVLFAIPAVGGNYWTTFFPAFLVLGFGMAVSVAPLTTLVMSAVDQDRAGAASGINNAVARVAGLLAIAVLGIVMVSSFSAHLDRSLARLPVPTEVMKNLESNYTKLAAIEMPVGLDPNTSDEITASVNQAFVFGFRLIMLICAGLSVLGAAQAWLLIGSKPTPSRSTRKVFVNPPGPETATSATPGKSSPCAIIAGIQSTTKPL
jgi:EmrB/QacA subfamily drug resistance transporter